ncbi:hypothetical protein [Dyadobacter sp. BHUBP1]|uniref:hypothetical protein n=1 Tax=Dyadobacter sp. BHUBP1 TaxID=3424178 RepID=UPI003D3394CE
MTPTVNNVDDNCETRLLNPRITIVAPDITGGSQMHTWENIEDRDLFKKVYQNYSNETTTVSTKVKAVELIDKTKAQGTKVSLGNLVSALSSLHPIITAFSSEIKKFGAPKGFDKQFVLKEFMRTSLKLAQLSFEKVAVESISGKGLRFTLGFSDDRMLLIDKNLDYKVFGENEIVFSLFANRELIASNAADIDEFVPSFKEYLLL